MSEMRLYTLAYYEGAVAAYKKGVEAFGGFRLGQWESMLNDMRYLESQLTARNNDVAEMVEALKPFADIVSEIEHREDNMLATALLSDCKNAEKILAKHATPDDKDVG